MEVRVGAVLVLRWDIIVLMHFLEVTTVLEYQQYHVIFSAVALELVKVVVASTVLVVRRRCRNNSQ